MIYILMIKVRKKQILSKSMNDYCEKMEDKYKSILKELENIP